MPWRRFSRYRLRKCLRSSYATEEVEKAALARWASHQKEGTAAGQLMEYCRAGLSPVAFWSALAFPTVAFAGLMLLLEYDRWVPAGVSGALIAMIGMGMNVVLPPLVRALLHPHARRAALWLAWLGEAAAIEPLVRTLRYAPRSKAGRLWSEAVESALAHLLDTLDGKILTQESHDALCGLIVRAYPKSRTKAPRDLTEGRASLLIAILRYLYNLSESPAVLPLFSHLVAQPADARTQPHRFLVRELACVYANVCEGRNLVLVTPPVVVGNEPSLATLRAVLTRRL